MKQPNIRSAMGPGSGFAVNQNLSFAMAFSLVGHVVFFLLAIFLPKVSLDSDRPAHYINVQLVAPSVSLPASAPVAEIPAAMPEQTSPESISSAVAETAPSTPQAAAKASPEAVSLAPSSEIEKKQSMKKRTYKRQRVMESAIKNVEEQVTFSQTDQRQQALDRIRSQVEEQASQAGQETASEAATEGAGQWGEGVSSTDIERIYSAEVAFHIKKNWAFSEQMAGGEKNLYNEVVIIIARSGNIDEIWFDRRSGNSYFDDSTYKAILKSSPLPAIPDEISGSSLTLGFRFNPDGLR